MKNQFISNMLTVVAMFFSYAFWANLLNENLALAVLPAVAIIIVGVVKVIFEEKPRYRFIIRQ